MTDTIDMNDVRLAYHAAVDRFIPDSLNTEHWVRRLRVQLGRKELPRHLAADPGLDPAGTATRRL